MSTGDDRSAELGLVIASLTRTLEAVQAVVEVLPVLLDRCNAEAHDQLTIDGEAEEEEASAT